MEDELNQLRRRAGLPVKQERLVEATFAQYMAMFKPYMPFYPARLQSKHGVLPTGETITHLVTWCKTVLKRDDDSDSEYLGIAYDVAQNGWDAQSDDESRRDEIRRGHGNDPEDKELLDKFARFMSASEFKRVYKTDQTDRYKPSLGLDFSLKDVSLIFARLLESKRKAAETRMLTEMRRRAGII